MFSIGFTIDPLQYPYDDATVPAASGKMTLGKSEEEFLSNLSLWDKSDYEVHWKRELRALLQGASKVALIVSYDDPKAASNMEIWRIYRDGEWARFQNQLLSFDCLPEDFKITEMDRYIQDREVTNADGHVISEWMVPLRDIEIFLRGSNAL